MADADSVAANEAGVALNVPGLKNGDALPWRVWPGRYERNIGDVVNNPATQEWNNTYNGIPAGGTADLGAQVKMLDEQLAWKHKFSNGKTYDPGDILIGLGEFLIKQGIL